MSHHETCLESWTAKTCWFWTGLQTCCGRATFGEKVIWFHILFLSLGLAPWPTTRSMLVKKAARGLLVNLSTSWLLLPMHLSVPFWLLSGKQPYPAVPTGTKPFRGQSAAREIWLGGNDWQTHKWSGVCRSYGKSFATDVFGIHLFHPNETAWGIRQTWMATIRVRPLFNGAAKHRFRLLKCRWKLKKTCRARGDSVLWDEVFGSPNHVVATSVISWPYQGTSWPWRPGHRSAASSTDGDWSRGCRAAVNLLSTLSAVVTL